MPEENTANEMHDAEDMAGGAMAGDDVTGADPAANSADQPRPVDTPEMVVDRGGSLQDQTTADLSMILDIPVTLSMEIGQTRISISELLKLSKDSVIELQRMADEPMDVLVNGTLVAHGEAVVVGDRFGIRLTDVISPQERLKKFA